MGVTDKVKEYLKEVNPSKSEKKKINDFVKLLKKKNIKKFGADNFDKLVKQGKLDTEFVLTFWNQVKAALEKAKIKVESEQFEFDLEEKGE